jgi:hypothetical protein
MPTITGVCVGELAKSREGLSSPAFSTYSCEQLVGEPKQLEKGKEKIYDIDPTATPMRGCRFGLSI